MGERVVTTQVELDAALADTTDQRTIYIDSPAGAWLRIRGGAHVVAWGHAHVEARDDAHVEARDGAHVVAWGHAHVEARDGAHVEARDGAHVEARDGAHVEAWDDAHVEAWDGAHVEARGHAHVVAWGHAHVEAGRYVAIHLHSARATVQGGVLIDLTQIDWTDPQQWCEYHGVPVEDGRAILYKALPDDVTTGQGYDHPVTWTPGATVVAADWRETNDCGFGLHLSPHPNLAREYRPDATRYMRVSVELATMRPIPGTGAAKCKVPQALVLGEVDRWCDPVPVPVEGTPG